MRLVLQLDDMAFAALIRLAEAERRPVAYQTEHAWRDENCP